MRFAEIVRNSGRKLSLFGNIISGVLFLAALFLGAVMTFAVPKAEFSENENKYLAEFPRFSVSSIREKTFMSGFEDYSADHFPARSAWIGLQTRLQLLLGQREVNGVYILKDRLLEQVDPPAGKNVANSVLAMNEFAERFGGVTYLMLVPTAAEIYHGMLPPGAPTLSERTTIDEVYKKVQNVTTVDAYASLSTNSEQYLYYRSDHHWTSRGAYLGYGALSAKMGFTPVSLDRFNVEHASHSFRGSLYSKVIYKGVDADTVDLYSYPSGAKVTGVSVFDGTNWEERDSLYCREFLDKKDQYSVFLGQNQPVVTITTDYPGGNSLIIFKDSYAHSLAPFLALHYSKITLVDLRYLVVPFERVVDLDGYSQALFCYNVKTFVDEDNVRKVNLKP